MESFFVISDVVGDEDLKFVTGYWTGRKLVPEIVEAKRYLSVSDAEIDLRSGSFYDPAVHEVEEKEGGALEKTRFFDMVNKYGAAGSK